MDMGQCNDAFSAVTVALALADAFGCDVNELPLTIILSWYEQKAVCVLLTLLYLGIRNIKLGPTLPAFVSPNVLAYLVEHFRISPISTPEEDEPIGCFGKMTERAAGKDTTTGHWEIAAAPPPHELTDRERGTGHVRAEVQARL